jgi:YbbR domain-containing protein
MNLLRGWLLDNLGIKLVALLLALLVYLNVYTDRPATLIVSFPIQIAELADSLSLSGPVPSAVQAELRGTGKQLIRMRLTEPPVRLSLAGVGTGRYERALTSADLPLPSDIEIQVERVVSPRTVELQVDHKRARRLPVAARVEGLPAGGVVWTGELVADPAFVEVTGPERQVMALDSVRLDPVRVAGKRDTVRLAVGADALPDWCAMEPEQVTVTVPLEPEATRRIALRVESPHGAAGYTVVPERVTLTVSARRSLLGPRALGAQRVHWTAPEPVAEFIGRRVGLRRIGDMPEGARVRLDPDSVTLHRARR